MTVASLLIGVLTIGLYVVLLLGVGWLVRWGLSLAGVALPAEATKFWLVVVALIALIMLVRLVFFAMPMPVLW